MENIFGSRKEFPNQKENGEQPDSHISDESGNLIELLDDIEYGKGQEGEEGIKQRQGDYGRRIGDIHIVSLIDDTDRKACWPSVDLSADQGGKIPDDSREKEGYNDDVKVFFVRLLVSVDLVEHHEHKTGDSPDERQVVIRHQKEIYQSVLYEVFVIPPFRDNEKQSRKQERRSYENESISRKKILIYPGFLAHFLEHVHKGDEREGKPKSKRVDFEFGKWEKQVRIHGVLC